MQILQTTAVEKSNRCIDDMWKTSGVKPLSPICLSRGILYDTL